MNSFNQTRNMSRKGTGKQVIPAPKLMAIENEYHRTKDALVHEIKRLRGEVGVLAKRYNNARREINDLVRRVRSQPPPAIPRRDDETEGKIAERKEKMKQFLEKEEERKKEEEGKKEADIVMAFATETEPEPMQPTDEEAINILSPEQPPLDQSPRPQSPEPSKPKLDVLEQTQLSDNDSDVEMVEQEAGKGKEKEKEIREITMFVARGWGKRLMRMNKDVMWRELEGKQKRWEEITKMMGVKKNVLELGGDMRKIEAKVKEVVEEWVKARKRGKYRGWADLREEDGVLYVLKDENWDLYINDNGFTVERG